MRERERKVRDGRKRREQGAETGIGRWDRRTERQYANGRETTGRLRREVSQRQGWKREEAGERPQREGLAGLGAPGQGGLMEEGRTEGHQGSYHDGSYARRHPHPRPHNSASLLLTIS